MAITSAGLGHLFRIPDNMAAYESNDFDATWADTQYHAFMESEAGEWLASKAIEYSFFVKAKLGQHGDCYIVIPDANQAMQFKLSWHDREANQAPT